ncbi:diaminohydroxyphosphoribosylaminopyrimidine deaminase/5-amino-6-(5-phosphoribosylamino)uracil reductase [Promicromonospora sp. AC04]|uniref:bifunctional diaminohydroxyphosphoribosylaminopyrimidine deaminase/5-amino-6-(5-phosphoribosylamino)uracil reductase RibD n=1 Tax=Promicromonospora sp. AC04 TaxID=2135723 RepID=UPI000D40E750|nr:bifunctional diaminohydroxyphosphoribosylaminopyrimidine deaminase/5-amino-6-(5-phosphoribosylamino)uracil reductase RibD [Promicromonospora sp. AC04]PUB26112.1 diaminohydroxyphosphoribosylaminopyrimidine deaminase/5-amino-6-(5-phosphoribosylamino)uracil reductase [Promicromonospora sp. AC04]
MNQARQGRATAPAATGPHALESAMRRALALAVQGPAYGPNPRVGCVLLDPGGHPVAEGFHRGAGTPHAEAAALADARSRGIDPRGTTAVVTLEPCAHHGRTGPCADALIDAGVAAVHVAVGDPNPVATGGAARLRAAGIEVTTGLLADEGEELLRPWLHAVRTGRPYVTLKLATSLDGRVAAPDGTSRWITGPRARAHAHTIRAQVDAIAVGSGTALTDDPSLTARTADGGLFEHQPLRVVLGRRTVPDGARLRGPGGPLLHLPERDLDVVLRELGDREVRHLLVEGGPTLATTLLAADAVDELHAYVAPVLLGAGATAVGDLGVTTIGEAARFATRDVTRLGDDMLMVARRAQPAQPEQPEQPEQKGRPSRHTKEEI